ncbi:MAG: AAA family ATPase, partial [Proteobacteria bacterium]|nr:AAA family ATPase [Pseudomonadota bacterium]
ITLILNEFEIEFKEGISKGSALALLYDFLIKKYSQGRKVLLIIDEAQNLSGEVLEEIRMLSNLQTDDEMLLQIMIVGQPQLKDKINDPSLEQFAQRIAVSHHLSALTLEETAEYIAFRLKKAGGDPSIFSYETVEKIYEVSKGIPRTINLLCDASLVYGFADEKKFIDTQILDQVIEDKGGMGVFTKDNIKKKALPDVQAAEEHKTLNQDLLRRVTDLETSFSQLKEVYHNYIGEMESRAQFCRDEMMNQMKETVKFERQQNKQLSYEYGKLKERYRLLLNKFKKP